MDLWCILLFLAPAFGGWWFLEYLDHQKEQELVRQERLDMREVLARLSELGDPQIRVQRIFDRFSQLAWRLDSFASRLSQLLTKEEGLLEAYLFKPDGKREPIPGVRDSLLFASQQFLRSVWNPEKEVPRKLVAGFAGNAEASRMMAFAPGTLVDLLNGGRKTWGGWWKIRDSQGRPIAQLVAFIHRNAISSDHLLDKACRELNQLLKNRFFCGWFTPYAPSNIRPLNIPLLQTMAHALHSLPQGVHSLTWNQRNLVLLPTNSGEVFFCVSASLQVPVFCFREIRPAWLISMVLLMLLFLVYRGRVKTLHGKIFWLYILGCGFPLLVFLLTVLFSRRDQERLLYKKTCEQNLDTVMQVDGNYYSFFQPHLNKFMEFSRELWRNEIRDVSPLYNKMKDVQKNSQGIITRMCVVKRGGEVPFFIRSGMVEDGGWKKDCGETLPQLGLGVLRLLNTELSSASTAVQDNFIDTIVNSDDPDRWFQMDGQLKKGFFGKGKVLTYMKFIPGFGGKYAGIFLAEQNYFLGQTRYIDWLRRLWKKDKRRSFQLFAFPVEAGFHLKYVPSSKILRHQALRKLRDQVMATSLPQHTLLTLAGKQFLVSALRCHFLDGYVLMLARPYSHLQKNVDEAGYQAAAISLFILLLGAGIAWFTSRILLVPLGNLSRSLEAFKAGDFSHKMPSSDLHEIAIVGNRFNIVMQEMKDLELAKTIQTTLWPQKGLEGQTWRIDGTCRTATNIGGDHHDWFLLPDGRLVFGIGDVAGHGIPAGLVAASMKMTLGISGELRNDPAAILMDMDRGMKQMIGKTRIMTFWLGILNPRTGEIQFSNAGNCYPIKVGKNTPAFLISEGRYPLGAGKNPNYQNGLLKMSRGDRIFLYSDGIPEALAPDKSMYGYERLLHFTESVREKTVVGAISELYQCVESWSNHAVPLDDQTIVILEVDSLP
ncbi:MAG: SpoIIE family protein phosphatase [Candidatus Ozemobacteraceae bacterium]